MIYSLGRRNVEITTGHSVWQMKTQVSSAKAQADGSKSGAFSAIHLRVALIQEGLGLCITFVDVVIVLQL